MSVPSSNDVLLQQTIPGRSTAVQRLREIVRRAAATDLPITIAGPLGVGKTHIARAIHGLSRRAVGPLVVVEPEYIRDGDAYDFFTKQLSAEPSQSNADKKAALGGTLVLRNLENGTQLFHNCLARFLDEEVKRHASDAWTRESSARIIVTVRNVALVRQRTRLLMSVASMDVPPLSDRPQDVEDVVRELIRLNAWNVDIRPGVFERLQAHHWPANIVSVTSAMELAMVLSEGEPSDSPVVIDDAALDAALKGSPRVDDHDLPTRDDLRLSRIAELESRIAVYEAESIRARPIWEGQRFAKREDYCFVLMPFADHSDVQSVYEHHIKTVMQRCGLICERADDIHDITGIMQSVWESVNKARLIVAEMTGRNSNVFYELGIAHTLGKPVIMITQAMDDVPSDLRHLRCITYSYKPNVIKSFEERLERTVRTILGSDRVEADVG